MENLSELPKQIRAAAYCRVSTEKEDQLASLETQRKFFEDYTKINNYTLVEIYADEGISGTKLKNRKAFNRMMSDAKKGKFEKVFVKDISRFSRNAVDFLNSIRELKSMGIKCDFVNSSLSTEDGEFTLGILALVAQEESANISKRIKFGKAKNAEKGKIPNIVYGYNKTIGKLFTLEINHAEAAVIRHIYSMYTEDGYGANKIANILNDKGIKTKRECKWSQNAVSRILRNPLYTGIVINGKEEVKDFLTGIRSKKSKDKWLIHKNPDLRIISDELFKKTQQIMAFHKSEFKISSKRQSCKYPFSTLIKCGCCGYSFRRVQRKFKTKDYIKWTCCGRNTYGKDFCDNHIYIDENELIKAIQNFLINLLNSHNTIKSETTKLVKKQFAKICSDSNESELKTELEKLRKMRRKQIEMFEADTITIEELKERTAELNTNIYSIENKLAIITKNKQEIEHIDKIVKKYCKNTEALLSLDIFDNQLLKQIIDNIIVYKNGNIDIKLKT